MTGLQALVPRHLTSNTCPQVWVKLIEIQDDGRGGMKISCSMKAVDQESGKDLDPTNAMAARPRGGGGGVGVPGDPNPPEIGSVHKATVVSIRAFGAFVRMEGYQSNGLVHVSQVAFFTIDCPEGTSDQRSMLNGMESLPL